MDHYPEISSREYNLEYPNKLSKVMNSDRYLLHWSGDNFGGELRDAEIRSDELERDGL